MDDRASATATLDYSKKAFEESMAATQQQLAARAVETTMRIQTEFAKAAYEGFVAQATKFSEHYARIAREAFEPAEGFLPTAVLASGAANAALEAEASSETISAPLLGRLADETGASPAPDEVRDLDINEQLEIIADLLARANIDVLEARASIAETEQKIRLWT